MDEQDRIGGLNETLYSRTRYRNPLDKRAAVKPLETPEVESGWQTPKLVEMLQRERSSSKTSPFIKKVFIFAVLFFIAAMVVGGFVFLGGSNFVSSKNVDITVLGPTVVSAGEPLELGVTVSNTNNADLELANLSIQYPSGTRNPDNTADPLTFKKESLGVIKAGDEEVRDVSMVLLGSTGEVKQIKFSVEYKVTGSNATFYKDKVYEITIGNAPVTMTVESPTSVTSGEDFLTTVSLTLNAKEVLRDVVLKAEYPHGYSYTDSNPKAAREGNIWVLGDLSPGDKKTIAIRGKLLGENEEERTFRFYIGVADAGTVVPTLKIPITSMQNTVAISRPLVGLDIALNGDDVPIYVSSPARAIDLSIRYKNNMSEKLINPKLEVSLRGAALDKFSVAPSSNGFYDSANSKVIWNINNLTGNAELNPGDSGQVTLRLASLPANSLGSGSKDITLNFSLTGVPVGSSNARPVIVTDARTIKISSQVNLSSNIIHSQGPFVNHGPIPPKAETETTYTATLRLSNTQVDMNEARLTARLGPGVKWLGAHSSDSENITYDEGTNVITWSVGQLTSNSATNSREVSFQVAITPSVSQIGTAPVLVSSIVFTGQDPISNNTVNVTNQNLTTSMPADPQYIQGDDIVTR